MATSPCERCRNGSWTADDICPWCRKHKTRGTREELAKQVWQLREVVINAVGFLADCSLLTKEQMQKRLVNVIKDTD